MAKKQLLPLVKCMDCKHAELHQWFMNPVISICRAQREERFVANCETRCQYYEHERGEKHIEQHLKYD